jgi:DNA-binding response OmpR family regulator
MDDLRPRIAVVNDRPEFLALVERVLEAAGPYEVYTYRDEETSLAELRALRPSLLIVDVLVAAVPSGWELALLAGADHELGPVPIIVTSPEVPGLGRRVEELRQVAGIRVLSKPFTVDELGAVVSEALSGTGRAEQGQHEPI